MPSLQSNMVYNFPLFKKFQWQNILPLIRLMFSVRVSNAVLERFFSSLGRVKGIQRASLSKQTLEDILWIQAEGPPMESYDPTNAIKEWDRANQKRKKAYKTGSRQNAFISTKILLMNHLKRVFLTATSVKTDQ